MSELADRAEAVRRLSGLLHAGLPIAAALSRWHEECTGPTRDAASAVARRVALGQSPAAAVQLLRGWGQDGHALGVVLRIHSRLGGDVARMLEAVAGSIEERDASLGDARAAGAGARVSSRVVGGLPLAFLPVAPAAGAPLLDPAGIVLIGAGVALVAAGMKWISRLMPRPPESDEIATAAATLVASVVRGGVPPALALDALAAAPPAGGDELRRARRLVCLGFGWTAALKRSLDPGLRSLGTVFEAAESFGLPLAGSLERFVSQRRKESARHFEAALKRSSVLMMVPLTLCVLPAFVLLGLGPFLRGLSMG